MLPERAVSLPKPSRWRKYPVKATAKIKFEHSKSICRSRYNTCFPWITRDGCHYLPRAKREIEAKRQCNESVLLCSWGWEILLDLGVVNRLSLVGICRVCIFWQVRSSAWRVRPLVFLTPVTVSFILLAGTKQKWNIWRSLRTWRCTVWTTLQSGCVEAWVPHVYGYWMGEYRLLLKWVLPQPVNSSLVRKGRGS